MTISFWQKYFRNELIAIEEILNSGDSDLFYGIPVSFCINRRKEILKSLLRVQINEYSKSDE